MTTTKQVGSIAVDSGQVLLVDPCYVLTGHAYEEVCGRTLDLCGFGQVAGGFATATLYGDGVYPVYAEVDSRGRIVSLTISFADEDEID